MEKENNLTVCILTKNEEAVISKCLGAINKLHPKSILVIDDNSTDKTREIAKKMGADVISYPKKDFADSRNYALSITKTSYLLYIDADEILSDGLILEINKTLENFQKSAYRILRQNYYLGKIWPKTEKITRLFNIQKLNNWYGAVHESSAVNGEIGELASPLNHYTHRNLAEMVENTLVWSKVEAELRYNAKHPKIVWWRIYRVMLTAFWDYYITQGGWKVGTVGLIESVYQSFSIFITYARLWELQQNN